MAGHAVPDDQGNEDEQGQDDKAGDHGADDGGRVGRAIFTLICTKSRKMR